jgi:hypothetical protein
MGGLESTSKILLSAAGVAFLIEAREILAHVERTAVAAKCAAHGSAGCRRETGGRTRSPIGLRPPCRRC